MRVEKEGFRERDGQTRPNYMDAGEPHPARKDREAKLGSTHLKVSAAQPLATSFFAIIVLFRDSR